MADIDIYKDMENLLDIGAELIEFYRNNPCIAAYDLLKVDLAPIQRIVLEDMWFKNYVITVASRGFGKCQSVDSMSFINNDGLYYLNEKFDKVPEFVGSGNSIEYTVDDVIYTDRGYRPIKKISLEHNIKGKRLVTKNGFENKGSDHHRLLTIDTDGSFVYKRLDEFKVGDRVCIQRNQNTFGSGIIPDDDAYLLGLFIGGGMISTEYNFAKIITSDKFIIEFCIEYCNTHNISYRIDQGTTNKTISIVFKDFDYFFKKYNVNKISTDDASIPISIRSSNRKSQLEFIRGYFDIAGASYKNGSASCCSVSQKIISELQLMLLNFGIISRRRVKKIKSLSTKSFILEIFSIDAYRFLNIIGFGSPPKQNKLINYFSVKHINSNKDTIPVVKDLCYDVVTIYKNNNSKISGENKLLNLSSYKHNAREYTYNKLEEFLLNTRSLQDSGYSVDNTSMSILSNLRKLLETNYYFDTVVSVTDWQGDCYDFEMDMGSDVEPNYFSNGFINHNTYILAVNALLHALLYPGYRVGLLGPSFRQCAFSDFKYLPIFTDKGLITSPQDFYNSIDANTKIQSLKTHNLIKNKWMNPKQKGLIIKTQRGFEIGGLYDHRVLVLNENCELVYKELRHIIKDDYLVIKKGFNYFGNDDSLPEFNFESNWRNKDCRIPTVLTSDLSYWMGLIVGDGCVSISRSGRRNRISFTNQDMDLIDSFKKYAKEYFIDDEIYERVENNKTHALQYSSKKLIYFLLECGLTKTTALNKKIPFVINKASKEMVCSFLSGLMDTDGCVYIQKANGGLSATVHLSTSSLQLAKEVQAWFLNMGIVSNLSVDKLASVRKLNGRSVDSNCATSYKVRITGIADIIKYRDNIGFRCVRKKNMLDDYINSMAGARRNNSNIIPNSTGLVLSLVNDCYKQLKCDGIEQNKFLDNIKRRCTDARGFSLERLQLLLEFACKYNVLTLEYYKLLSLIELDLFFVKPLEFIPHEAETIDIEVENEHCYWAGGFINHNSKMIFSEIEKIYSKSSILREACEKRPVRGADTCNLRFKGTSLSNGSFIEALPIGVDGAKIRGSRFYLVEIDELAQMLPDIIETVLRPMAAVVSEPMQKVREMQRIERLIKEGLATEDDLVVDVANKMVMTSSGYFKFNHMWHRMKTYWKAIKESSSGDVYAVHQIPYTMLPKGFLDMNNINEAKRTMSNIEFMMEYEAAMVSDSEGFFKASLLENCTRGSDFTVQTHGVSDREYILGIDPNQGGAALFGVVVIELGHPNKIVYAKGLKSQAVQDMTKFIQRLLKSFNIVRICMDAQGGGSAIKDLLSEGYNDDTPVLDIDDERVKYKNGRRILKMINFTPAWISEANFNTLALLENNRLRFPSTPTDGSEIDEKLYEDIRLLKSQMLNIVVTETARGVRHFDTPKKGQNKDLYSAIILAAYGVTEMARDAEFVEIPMEASGLVRPHASGSSFTNIRGFDSGRDYIQSAVLTRKI